MRACVPNDWSTLRGVMGEPVGPLFFAGEHCALDTQGFMEGGCESGQLAAEGDPRATHGRDFPHSGAPESRASPEAFCTRESFFAVQRAIHLTIPSLSPRIPTWGREQARNRFVRGGLFICDAIMER